MDKTTTTPKREFIRAAQAAKIIGVSTGTLAAWRFRNMGPTYYKLVKGKSGTIVYTLDDIDAWLDSCRVPTPNIPPTPK